MKLIKQLFRLLLVPVAITFAGCHGSAKTTDITSEEARAIAKEAYVYGFPMVDNYRIQYAYFIERGNTEYKAPYNQIRNIPRVYTPDDKAVQTPNSDTPYSLAGLDLRAEPMVLTVPAVEKERYYSIQLIDAYTHNFGYVGSRTTGNYSGSYLVAGPGWKGEPPRGVKKVIRSETEFVFAIYRTQLFRPDELDKVKKVQEGYQVEPLSAFLGQPAPQPAPAIQFVKPLTAEQQKTSIQFFNVLNFTLSSCPVNPSERELMERFAKIGVGGSKIFDTSNFSPEVNKAIRQGMSDAWTDFANLKKRIDAKEVNSGDLFGTREFLKNNYLYRMGAAVLGIYGNSKSEAMYPIYSVDSDGKPLNGANHYSLHFEPGKLPPVNGFWSATMYGLPGSLLVANPLHRYLLNSPMLRQFKKDADGGLSLFFQHESPGKEKEANWLPAPEKEFMVVMRLYWPKEEATSGEWTAPALKRG